MNARIGAATSHNRNFPPQQFAQRTLNHLLHANRILLVLPAVIVGPVVAYFEEVAHGIDQYFCGPSFNIPKHISNILLVLRWQFNATLLCGKEYRQCFWF